MHSSTEHCVAPPQVEKRQSSRPRPANSSELAQSGPAAAKEPAQAETLDGLFVRRFTRLQATTSTSVCMQTWKPLLMLKTGSYAIGLDSDRPISDDKLSTPRLGRAGCLADQSRSRLASSGERARALPFRLRQLTSARHRAQRGRKPTAGASRSTPTRPAGAGRHRPAPTHPNCDSNAMTILRCGGRAQTT